MYFLILITDQVLILEPFRKQQRQSSQEDGRVGRDGMRIQINKISNLGKLRKHSNQSSPDFTHQRDKADDIPAWWPRLGQGKSRNINSILIFKSWVPTFGRFLQFLLLTRTISTTWRMLIRRRQEPSSWTNSRISTTMTFITNRRVLKYMNRQMEILMPLYVEQAREDRLLAFLNTWNKGITE